MTAAIAVVRDAWGLVQRTNLRILIAAIIAGGVFQQHQLLNAQQVLAVQQLQLNSVQEAVEAQLILQCLDSTRTVDLRKARIPCQTLFNKYGIR